VKKITRYTRENDKAAHNSGYAHATKYKISVHNSELEWKIHWDNENQRKTGNIDALIMSIKENGIKSF